MSLRLFVSLCVVLVAGVAHGAKPRLEWSYNTKGKIYASPIIADLDGDGKQEVIVCASRNRSVICFDGQGEVRWQYRLLGEAGDGIQATPSAVDYDGDGRKEIFFADENGVVGCLDYNGKLIWRVFTGDRIDYSGPVVADVNGDGRVEVLFGTVSGTLYCLDDAGMELWHYQGKGAVQGIPAILRDPSSLAMRIYATFSAGVAACLSSEGKVLWSHNEPSPPEHRRSGHAVGDLDADGRAEVISATQDFQVIASDALTGQERWRWKGKHTIDQTNSFALADFDGSGRLDVVCGDGAGLGGPGNVYRLRDGKALWTADVRGGVVQGPSVGDVDGDGRLEILVGTRENRVVCLSEDGQQKWDYPCDAGAITTPAIGDVNGDGKTDVVFTSKDGYVRCITVGGTYSPARVPWPCINHDSQLSGNAAGAAFTATKASRPSRVPASLTVTGFGPLRTGENRIEVSLANPTFRPRHLEAAIRTIAPDGRVSTETISRRVAPYGKRTESVSVEVLSPGTHRLSVRLLDVGTGEIIATRGGAAGFVPLAWEQQEIRSRLARAAQLAAVLPDAGLRARAAKAVAAQQAALSRLVRASAAAGSARRSETRRRGTVAHSILRDCDRIVARVRAASATPGAKLDFAVAPVTTLRKVFRDEPLLAANATVAPASVSLARNEYEGVQLVVVPLWKNVPGLRVAASDAVRRGGAGRIPSRDITIERVGYIKIGPPEYNWLVEKLGYYPDVLFPAGAHDVPAGQDAQPYFVTVRTSKDTPPGDYAATVSFRAAGCAPVTVPLNVHVWGFAVPDQWHLKTSMWMSEGSLQSFYKYPGRTPFEVRKRFYDLHLAHRIGPLMTLPAEDSDNFPDFEYVMSRGQNSLFAHVPGYTPEPRRAALAEELRAQRALVQRKGWSDSALFYSRDEVAVMAREEIPQVVEMNEWTRSIIPEWPRLETSAPEQSLFGAVDIWCPTIDNFSPSVLAQRKAKGDRLWFYTVWGRPGIMIEFPATDHRLMFWQCWKYGAEGFLYYGTTGWSYNMSTEKRWPHIPWIPWNSQPGHNGCGYIIYPGPNGQPLSSIRLAVSRDGIEDYEYLYLLRDLLAKAGSRAPAAVRAQARAELAVRPELLVDNETFTEDPQAILSARARIASLIEQLRKVTGQ